MALTANQNDCQSMMVVQVAEGVAQFHGVISLCFRVSLAACTLLVSYPTVFYHWIRVVRNETAVLLPSEDRAPETQRSYINSERSNSGEECEPVFKLQKICLLRVLTLAHLRVHIHTSAPVHNLKHHTYPRRQQQPHQTPNTHTLVCTHIYNRFQRDS